MIEAKIIETLKDINTAKGIDWTGTLQSQHLSFGNGLTGGTTTATNPATTWPALQHHHGERGPHFHHGKPPHQHHQQQQQFRRHHCGQRLQAGGMTVNTANGFNPKTAFLNADGVSAVLEFLNTDADAKSIALPRTVSLDGQKTALAIRRNIPIFQQQQSARGKARASRGSGHGAAQL